MGRVAKKAPAPAAKEIEDSPLQTITQTRTRRTPKPNPKYNESVILPLKTESSDTPGSSDGEDKPADQIKVVKSVKKSAETPASVRGTKTPAAKGKAVIAKKQKLDYDDDEDMDENVVDDEKPAASAPRSTRSTKGDSKDTLKVGDESVAIVEISSIISKAPTKPDSPKNLRGAGRKRAVPEDTQKEDQAKKKKEDEKPSLITARKSYMPSPGLGKKAETKEKAKEAKVETEETDDETEVKLEVKTPAMKTRRAGAPAESLQSELVEKKVKAEEVKLENVKPEGKKVPILRKSDQIAKVSTPVTVVRTPGTLPTKAINIITTAAALNSPKPVPRILNSMVTPKGKQSPNVKLAGDGTDKKVFSIDLTDDSIKEKKILSSPIKTSPLRPPVAVKENVANNKPQPSTLLKNKLESELIRMKASANMMRRQMIPQHVPGRLSLPTQHQVQVGHNTNLGARRITKFESWYVIDVKNLEPSSFRHTHTHSLINLGNNIKDLQLPSTKWDYKVTLQRRQPRKENNNEEEVYTGDVNDKSIEADKASFEPSSILFKRSHRESNKISIDRSLMLKQSMYTITMNGKQCKLIGAPDDIKSIEDLEILLNIIDSSTLQHSCVELVSSHDIITIS